MKIYLVQHAEAKSKEEDPQRSLSEKGLADINRTASFVHNNLKIKVTRILHSGKTRAEQTAGILAEVVISEKGIDAADGLDPLDDPSIWAGRIGKTDDDLMLAGHLPHLQKLASKLLSPAETKDIIDFQQGGIVCLRRDDSGMWLVHWIITPTMING